MSRDGNNTVLLAPGALFAEGSPLGATSTPSRPEGDITPALPAPPVARGRWESVEPIIPGESKDARRRRLQAASRRRYNDRQKAKKKGRVATEDAYSGSKLDDPEPYDDPGEPSSFNEAAMEAMTRLLDEGEARKLRPEIIDAILESTERMDGILSATNRKQTQAEIWSTITEEQAGILADAALSLARTYRPAAYVIRAVSKGYLAWKSAAILLPRMWATLWWYPNNQGFTVRVPGMPDVSWVPSTPV